MKLPIHRIAVTAILVAAASLAHAQAWPQKPIKIVVPYPPGGTSDILARAIAPGLQAAFGQAIVIENKPGATGNLGAEFVAKAAPDGNTLLLADIGSLAISPSVFPTLPFDPVKNFAPVIMVAYSPHILAAHPSVPAKNVKELIALREGQARQAQLRHLRASAAPITSRASTSRCAPALNGPTSRTRAAPRRSPT